MPYIPLRQICWFDLNQITRTNPHSFSKLLTNDEARRIAANGEAAEFLDQLFFRFVFRLTGLGTARHAISAPAGCRLGIATVGATPSCTVKASLRISGKDANHKTDHSSCYKHTQHFVLPRYQNNFIKDRSAVISIIANPDEARRLAANITKLPELLPKPA